MINGLHAIVFSPEADKVRAFFRDVLGMSSVDAGGGWLIFALPPAELGVHPSDTPRHELSLLCDDLDATIAELRAKGIEFRGEKGEERWGLTITMVLPGNLEVLLYQPLHPTAHGRYAAV
jgi:catechol 2,3-dioxygenase-like lactoylglutathione lyase family enzyme